MLMIALSGSTYVPNLSSVDKTEVLTVPVGAAVSTTVTVRIAVEVVFPSVAVYTTSNVPATVFCTLLRSVVVNCEP